MYTQNVDELSKQTQAVQDIIAAAQVRTQTQTIGDSHSETYTLYDFWGELTTLTVYLEKKTAQ